MKFPIAYFTLIAVLYISNGVQSLTFEEVSFNKDTKLIFAHVIFRHGERSPVSAYPTDPNVESDFPSEYGQLTNKGKMDLFNLGKFLRIRYTSLLSANYSKKQIYVESSDVDRAVESAQACLSRLYVPTKEDQWNPQINWNPITVHINPAAIDFLTPSELPTCPTYDAKFNEFLSTNDDVQQILKKSEDLRKYLASNSGLETNSTDPYEALGYSLILRDILKSEDSFGATMPLWTNLAFESKEFDDLALIWYKIFSFTPELAKLRSGFLLKDITDRSSDKLAAKLKQPNNSVHMFSTHDTVIASMLNSLGVYDNDFIAYGAALLFELRLKDDVPYLQIYYKKSAQSTRVVLLHLPKCAFPCKWEAFIKSCSDIMPDTNDFKAECNK